MYNNYAEFKILRDEITKMNDKEFEKSLVEGSKKIGWQQKIGITLIFASIVSGACLSSVGVNHKDANPKQVQKSKIEQKTIYKNIQNQRM